jgi:two-component system chemotaxis sensor kinase CheA
MTIDMSQFIAVFFDEAAEHLASLESLLLKIDIKAPDPEDLNAIFRAAHSIKGGAATFGFSDLTEVTHVLENLLDRIRKNEITLTAEMVDAFLQSGDVLQAMLACHREQQVMDQAQITQITATLNHLLRDQTPVVATNAASTWLDQPAVAEADDSFGFFSSEESHLEVDEGFGFFDSQPEIQPQASTEEPSEENGYGFFQPLPTPVVSSVAASNEPVATLPVRAMPERGADKNTDSSIRVSVEKVDQLLNLVGELVITQSMLAQNSLQLDPVLHEKLLSGVAQLERNTRELQESVMSIRMMPISFVFNRYPRLVRDLAAKLGKQVELRMIGESTELDKGFIEKLSDPLTHLVRNSLDHGIESPEKRQSQNKPAQGILTLKAFHQGGNIVIEVSDDGAGLHRESR